MRARDAVLVLVFAAVTRAAAISGSRPASAQEVFNRARGRVRLQLTRSSNYTCVETIDRQYSVRQGLRSEGCEFRAPATSRKPFMHDRLRLDVAVSDGGEMFSWHGGKRFHTGSIDELVRTGPISSGSFVGYLENVFFHPGVQMRMMASVADANRPYHFEFDVPLSASGQYVSDGRGRSLVAFDGEMEFDPDTFDLLRLTTRIESTPKSSRICSAKSSVEYQTVPISGADARIPKDFTLEIDDSTHVYTVSRSVYSQCRAFSGESTISYNIEPASGSIKIAHSAPEEILPAGLTLPVALETTVDDLGSFAGDPARGVLTRDVKLPHNRGVISKGALLTGFVSRLETRFMPSIHVVIGIRFTHLEDGGRSYNLDSESEGTPLISESLAHIYGRPLPDYVKQNLSSGVFVFPTNHARIDSKFRADWKSLRVDEGKR